MGGTGVGICQAMLGIAKYFFSKESLAKGLGLAFWES
jgi:hypothetical protein